VATGAGGDDREFTGAKDAVVEGHAAGEYALGGMGPKENVPSGNRRPQKTGVCAIGVLRIAFMRIQPETILSCIGAVLLQQYPIEADPLVSSSTTPNDPCGAFLRSAFRAGLIREKNNLADLQA
jgi:hypothetical protein